MNTTQIRNKGTGIVLSVTRFNDGSVLLAEDRRAGYAVSADSVDELITALGGNSGTTLVEARERVLSKLRTTIQAQVERKLMVLTKGGLYQEPDSEKRELAALATQLRVLDTLMNQEGEAEKEDLFSGKSDA